jgi:hypothetical protein
MIVVLIVSCTTRFVHDNVSFRVVFTGTLGALIERVKIDSNHNLREY